MLFAMAANTLYQLSKYFSLAGLTTLDTFIQSMHVELQNAAKHSFATTIATNL